MAPARRKSVSTPRARREVGRQRIVLGLGSNLGDRLANLRRAAASVAEIPGVCVVAGSRVYETPPAGGPTQSDYLNAAVLVRTALPPLRLLEAVLAIERALGRARPDPVRWGPRTIDIDLLWCSARRFNTAGLTIPHPRLADRTFALRPLLDLVPDARGPDGAPYRELPAARAAIACVGKL